MESGQRAWGIVVLMRGRIVPLFVNPRQSSVIACYDNDLRNPHHRWAAGPGFSTFQNICQLPPNPHGTFRNGRRSTSARLFYKYTRGLRLDRRLAGPDAGHFALDSATLGPALAKSPGKKNVRLLGYTNV
jgi:hypothetical protein